MKTNQTQKSNRVLTALYSVAVDSHAEKLVSAYNALWAIEPMFAQQFAATEVGLIRAQEAFMTLAGASTLIGGDEVFRALLNGAAEEDIRRGDRAMEMVY